MGKYAQLRERVERELPGVSLFEPEAASDDDLLLAHDEAYVRRVTNGDLTAAEQRVIGFPWSAQMVERSRRSVGATLAACAAARREGVAVNLAGGTHHAHRGHGQGYCVFNDAAVAALALCRAPRERVAIIDLDVHQGDGTAAMLGTHERAFTLSLHGSRNYPARKFNGHIDVGLPDGVGDRVYLDALEDALARLRSRFAPTFLIYLAGADPHEGDRLGRLRLTFEGLRARDRRIFDLAASLDVPIAVMMAGGYGHELAATVQVHLNTVQAAYAHWLRCRSKRHMESTLD